MESLYNLFEKSWLEKIVMAKDEQDKKIDEYEMIIARAKRDIKYEKEKFESKVKRKSMHLEKYKNTLDAWKNGIFDFAYGNFSQIERLSYNDYQNGDYSKEAIESLHWRLSEFVDDILNPCFTVFFKNDPEMKCLGCKCLYEKIAISLQK